MAERFEMIVGKQSNMLTVKQLRHFLKQFNNGDTIRRRGSAIEIVNGKAFRGIIDLKTGEAAVNILEVYDEKDWTA